MPHVNAPLTPTGRLRMVRRHLEDGIPKAHVAAEFRVSRPTVTTWVARYLAAGEAGLADRPSVPRHSPQRTPVVVVELIESCGGNGSGPPDASTATCSVSATSCTCARWAGG